MEAVEAHILAHNERWVQGHSSCFTSWGFSRRVWHLSWCFADCDVSVLSRCLTSVGYRRHREFTFWLTKVVLWSENRRAGRVIGYRLRVDLSTAAVVEALAQLVRAGQGREAEPLIVPPPYPGSDVPPPPQQYQPQPPGYTPGMYQPPQPEQYPPAPPAEPPLNHQALQPAPEPSAPPSEAFSGTAPICPRCHHEVVVKGARFCQACGSALP